MLFIRSNNNNNFKIRRPVQRIILRAPPQIVRIHRVRQCRANNGLPCGICKPGHVHKCKICGMYDSDHRSKNCPALNHYVRKSKNKIKNATIICLSRDRKRIFLVYDRRGFWVTPGGGIERKDGNSLWYCAKREWTEETGDTLPSFRKKDSTRGLDKYDDYKFNTRLYVGTTNDKIKYSPTRETAYGKWFSINEFFRKRILIRSSVKNSFLNLYHKGMI